MFFEGKVAGIKRLLYLLFVSKDDSKDCGVWDGSFLMCWSIYRKENNIFRFLNF